MLYLRTLYILLANCISCTYIESADPHIGYCEAREKYPPRGPIDRLLLFAQRKPEEHLRPDKLRIFKSPSPFDIFA